jgi:hypothetical protein
MDSSIHGSAVPTDKAERCCCVCAAQISLQQHGLYQWSIHLLSIAVVTPSRQPAEMPCQLQWARWCLDNTPFTPELIYIIIAFGAAVLLLGTIAVFVFREVARNTGKASHTSPSPPPPTMLACTLHMPVSCSAE